MKKLLTMLLAGALVLSLAACGGETAPEETEEETAQPTTEPEEPAAEAEDAEDAAPEEDGGTLIAYFSWSGNTEQVAQLIQEATGGDLFEITPAVPYTDDYDELLDIARQEQSDSARPELAAQVENWGRYDTVFVGYPNWWSDAPMVVYTFLESYDWTGKTLIPFNTSASGGFGRSLDNLAGSAAGATFLEGISFTERTLEDAQSEVPAWLDGLGLS
ncbi:flavodoxin [uncultured Oscillibacter sp.]|uniref:flavodoxin n=1 Tax=uncultured Oscillibacter sp. TaxID=876091 RepID=UPI0028060206|nr:flavodoxin [uncultured Oscillibacter sp.]